MMRAAAITAIANGRVGSLALRFDSREANLACCSWISCQRYVMVGPSERSAMSLFPVKCSPMRTCRPRLSHRAMRLDVWAGLAGYRLLTSSAVGGDAQQCRDLCLIHEPFVCFPGIVILCLMQTPVDDCPRFHHFLDGH